MGIVNGFRNAEVDPHFQDEYDFVRSEGAKTALYDHEAVGSSFACVKPDPDFTGQALVRGWMITPSNYAAWFLELAAQGIHLATTPLLYERAHQLPNWHGSIDPSIIAPAVWAKTRDALDLDALPAGSGMVKDYVKSLKHNLAATRIEDVHNAKSVQTTTDLFLEERGQDLVGGLVVRAWEDLEKGEWRAWFKKDKLVCLAPHPDNDGAELDALDEDILENASKSLAKLGTEFATVDFALSKSGQWRVIEIGDGQVSDRPRSVDPKNVLESFL